MHYKFNKNITSFGKLKKTVLWVISFIMSKNIGTVLV